MTNGQIPSYFLATALMAHSASRSIFELLLEDSILKESLVGVPFYFHVMISFAGQFMLSCAPQSEQLRVDAKDDIELMHRAILMFKSITCVAAHPLQRMTAALERRFHECRAMLEVGHRQEHLNGAANDNSQPGMFQPSKHPVVDRQWGNTHVNGNNDVEGNGVRTDGRTNHQLGTSQAFPSAIGRPVDASNPHSDYMAGTDSNLPNRLDTDSEPFGIVPLSQPYVMSSDTIYQDFAGFDFPGFQLNFNAGPT